MRTTFATTPVIAPCVPPMSRGPLRNDFWPCPVENLWKTHLPCGKLKRTTPPKIVPRTRLVHCS